MNFRQLAFAFLIMMLASPALADDADKTKHIRHLFDVMHVEDTERQGLDLSVGLIINMHKKLKPEIPAKFWEDSQRILIEEFKKSLEEMNKSKAIIYAHHYSDDEIKQLTAFYESPIGQKVIKETPQITKESFEIAKVWGQEVGMRAAARLKELAKQKGYAI